MATARPSIELSQLAPAKGDTNATATLSQTSAQQSGSGSTTAPVDGLENQIEDLMGRIDARGKVMKKKARKACIDKTCNIISIVIATILGILGLFFTIYGLYRFSGPANTISEEGLQAAEWSNYYNWVWTICPAEQVNSTSISTPPYPS